MRVSTWRNRVRHSLIGWKVTAEDGSRDMAEPLSGGGAAEEATICWNEISGQGSLRRVNVRGSVSCGKEKQINDSRSNLEQKHKSIKHN